MKDLKKLLEIGFEFHGHRCPAMPLGLRSGQAALKALGVERASNKELFCYVETGSDHATMCFVDGVQVSTGCTYGKSNLVKLEYGKNAINLIDVKTKKKVRVKLNPEFQKRGLASEFVKLRAKGIEPKDIKPEIVYPLIEKIISLPDEELLIVGDVHNVDFASPKGSFEWHECANCGEIVFATKIRIVNGKHVCIPCSGYTA